MFKQNKKTLYMEGFDIWIDLGKWNENNEKKKKKKGGNTKIHLEIKTINSTKKQWKMSK